MAEYALLMNGEFKEIRHYEERPVNLPHKAVEWLPVDYREDQEESSIKEEDVWVVYFVAPKRMVEKSTILDRLTDDQLEQAINLMSTRQLERWRMPGHPSVYSDDPEVVGLIQAVGANPEEVLA